MPPATVPRAVLFAAVTTPAEIVVAPVYELAPDKVNVPDPSLVNVPEPVLICHFHRLLN